MIFVGSRYVRSTPIRVVSSSSLLAEGIPTLVDRKHYTADDLEEGWFMRRVTGNTELDLLAFQIGGREGLWFLIADVNDIDDPFEELTEGATMIVPTHESFAKVLRDLR